MQKKIIICIKYFFIIGTCVTIIEILLATFEPFGSSSFNYKADQCYWDLEEHTSLMRNFSKEEFFFDREDRGGVTNGSRKFKVERNTNAFRIICVGSSSTIGEDAEESEGTDHYPLFLQNLLRRDGKNIEVINGGIGGVGFYPLYIYFRDVLLHLEPQLVIVYFGANGDLWEYVDYYRRARETLQRFPHIRTNRDLVAAMDIKTNSRVFLSIYMVLIKHSRIFYNLKRLADYIKDYEKYRDLDMGDRTLWDNIDEDNIDEFVNLCVSRDIAVILIPEICVKEGNTFVFDEHSYNEFFYDMARKYHNKHVYYLRLHERLAHEINQPKSFFADTMHMTKQGYMWLASSIYEFIKETVEIEGSNLVFK